MGKDRERELFLASDAKVIVSRSSDHPIEYAIMLAVYRYGHWHTVRTFDNAHARDDHHEHRYAADKKQDPVITNGPINEAMATAEQSILDGWRQMVDEWEKTR